eukprot:TRINITY_DN16422_c0_g1_i5.p1 TRINITY_DN16422_c0_g1~~TRINITY_DN16422_c0_g1_i5.p1  ORF type:complete len:197 (+),score=12.94 TRINITY_DN16422_c0_g1_i5:63-653(+)
MVAVNNTFLNICVIEYIGGFSFEQSDDHLSMLLLGLFALKIELNDASRIQLEKQVLYSFESGHKLSQLQLSHILTGCGGLRLLDEEQFASVCDRFLQQVHLVKRAYCLNEVMLGIIARGYSGTQHTALVAGIFDACLPFLCQTNKKISQNQKLSLLQGLQILGIDGNVIKAKMMELRFEGKLNMGMLSIAEFGQEI